MSGMKLGLYAIFIAILSLMTSCVTTVPEPLPGDSKSMEAPLPVFKDWPLLPQPRHMEVLGSAQAIEMANYHFPDKQPFALRSAYMDAIVSLYNALTDSMFFEISYINNGTKIVDPERVPQPQGYEIRIALIAPDTQFAKIEVVAHDEAGLFYAAQTIKQLANLARERGVVPICHIRDWPDFPNRGVMLDVARDKVPEMETLYALVDKFASWKYNQLQLYTEHTFAYEGYHVVWENASPMTLAQIRALDQYCKERFIQLIPNQNSFGHMGRWLQHPEYAGLSELPGGSNLCPVDEGSIELLRSMYTFMLPSFSSPYANVGCDETWSLGKGRSKAATEERGVGRVYLEFLMKIHGLIQENGKTMQFWADIINNHPELIPELPEDIVAMEWGYEANHPYASHTKRFHDHGVRFYVVPGTSTWNSLLGRTDNAMANLLNAAENGKKYGGEGFLVTDWGDGGHWQFQPISYLPFVYGAALSWCVDTNRDADVPALADRYAFEDPAGVMGQAAFDLGNAHLKTGAIFGNSTPYYMFLLRNIEKPLGEVGMGGIKEDDLNATVEHIDAILERMEKADMQCPDADLILSEFQMNAALAKFSCRLGAARIQAGGVPTSALSKAVRAPLAEELRAMIPEYRQLWLMRSRSGGLKDSVGRFENLLAILSR